MTTLKEYAARVETRLQDLLPGGGAVVNDAMRYSAMAGGKRLRPAMLLAAADMLGGAPEALDFACAVEMVHTYSLIHDDLPCMDDDDMRRGKPTNHKVYGETLAVLAGDALQPEAYRLILTAPGLDESRRAACGRILAEASGADGMVAILLDCFNCSSLRMAIKRSSTWGTPKYPSPQERVEMMVRNP